MPRITVAEALGELAQIDQRLATKQQLIESFLVRDAALHDPLRNEGGTLSALAQEKAGLAALRERKVLLSRAIQTINAQTTLTFKDITRSIADWMAWKRDVLPTRTKFLQQLRGWIMWARSVPRTKAGAVVAQIDEKSLLEEIELLEEVQGWLQGQLNLKNAILTLDVPEPIGRTPLEERSGELTRRGMVQPLVSVVLTGLRDLTLKISVIKTLRELTGLGLAEAKLLSERCPAAVKTHLSRADAEVYRQQLEAAGGVVSLQ